MSACHIGKQRIHVIKLRKARLQFRAVLLVKALFPALYDQKLCRLHTIAAPFFANPVNSGIFMLIIIIQRFVHKFKMTEMSHPQGTCGIILIKDLFREAQTILINDAFLVNLDHHTARL